MGPTRRLRAQRGWIVLLLVAVLLAYARVPLISAQGTTLAPAAISDALPVDPMDTTWSGAPSVTLPMTAQSLWIPTGGGSVTSVTARALRNDTWIAFRVEWSDATKDARGFRTEDFPDAVAVQIAAGSTEPFVCMGQVDSQVQIWHWRADRDVIAGADPSMEAAYPYAYADLYPFEDDPAFYPGLSVGNFLSAHNTTPVQTLVGGGPGTLTSADVHAVYGRGHHEQGRWSVVFLRPLAAPSSEEVSLEDGARYSVAFAVWDGSRGDRDGLKSTSNWVTLSLERPGAASGTWWWPLGAVGVVAIAVLLFVPLAARRRRRRGRGDGDEPEAGDSEG